MWWSGESLLPCLHGNRLDDACVSRYLLPRRRNGYATTFNLGITGLSNKSIGCLSLSFLANAA